MSGEYFPVRLTDLNEINRAGESNGMHIRVSVLYIHIPEPGSNEDLHFHKRTQFTLLVPVNAEMHILDPSRRMICVAFSCIHSKSMGILVMFDWDTEEAAVFDTGLPYVRFPIRILTYVEINMILCAGIWQISDRCPAI